MGGGARVGLYDDPLFREHDPGAGHPEGRERLEALRLGIRRAGLEAALDFPAAPDATDEQLLRVHSASHLARLRALRGRHARLDPDTHVSPRSLEAAVRAAGAVVDAVDRVLDGSLDRALCAVRPPGHHAEAERAMGFCLFNNVAVGAAHALARGLERVLVVDYDVHHGNGTQWSFYEDPRVLFVSSHAYPFFPGTGDFDEAGRGAGEGFTVNLPLPGGLDDAFHVSLYREVVQPVAEAFSPQLVLVSAGFDSHEADPIGPMAMTERGFACLTGVCLEAAAGGRVVLVFEGGYDAEAVAASAEAVTRVLLGEPAPAVASCSGPARALVERCRARHAPRWPCLRG